MSPQNIYDDERFFTGYAEMRAARTGLNEVLEQPALHRLLPPLDGLRVLDIGCGAGDFARHARSRGACHVLGIDVSERMLESARAGTSDPAIEYRRTAIETLPSFPVPFDLAVSSLALHYVDDYAGALLRIAEAIRPGGDLVFSVEHPMMTALQEQSWQRDADGKALYWPIDNYANEGVRNTCWFVDGVIKYHRTVSSYVDGLLRAGFRLTALAEPAPSDADIAERPDLADQRRRPPFLMLAGERLAG